jgi:hypothetical protein
MPLRGNGMDTDFFAVIPAHAGIHPKRGRLDPRVRGDDVDSIKEIRVHP